MSSYTKFLAAMFGNRLHQYVDPNVLFADDELRKMLEIIIVGIILTLQERPTSTKQSFRLDLWKKLCSANGLLSRMPYAILSKILSVIGWKRFELNHLL